VVEEEVMKVSSHGANSMRAIKTPEIKVVGQVAVAQDGAHPKEF